MIYRNQLDTTNDFEARQEILTTWASHLNLSLMRVKGIVHPDSERVCDVCQAESSSNAPILVGGDFNAHSDEDDSDGDEDSGLLIDAEAGDHNTNTSSNRPGSICTCKSSRAREIPDDISETPFYVVIDPFNLNGTLYSDVKKLATLCFENACYGADLCSLKRDDGEDAMNVFLRYHFYTVDVVRVHDHIIGVRDLKRRRNIWGTFIECLQS